MVEMKPCPFCGGKADLCNWNGGGVSWVQCSECGANTEAKQDPLIAARAWNTRVERTCHTMLVKDFAGYREIQCCSECKEAWSYVRSYCPNCGAKVVEQMEEHIVEIGPAFGDVKIKNQLIRCRDCKYFREGSLSCSYYSDSKWLCLTPPDGYCSRAVGSADV